MRLFSTKSGVASNFVLAINLGSRRARSPVWNSQLRTRRSTFAGVICCSGEKRVPPRSPPQWSQAKAGLVERCPGEQTSNSIINMRAAYLPLDLVNARRNSGGRTQRPCPMGVRCKVGRRACAGDSPSMHGERRFKDTHETAMYNRRALCFNTPAMFRSRVVECPLLRPPSNRRTRRPSIQVGTDGAPHVIDGGTWGRAAIALGSTVGAFRAV